MIVITRILTATTNSGPTEVPIHIHAPTQGDRCWECNFSIGWPEGDIEGIVRGFDSVQALYLAMKNIAVRLYASPYHAEGKLCWDKPGAGYGFPMPTSGYEDLIGEDRIAQVPD